jgi:hypothetical protein
MKEIHPVLDFFLSLLGGMNQKVARPGEAVVAHIFG